jgi:hypothetical protein
MTRVWICQCLCPSRHAIVATSGEADSEAAAEETVARPAREAVAIMLRSGAIDPWCGLCRAGSETWRYETRRSRFRTMAEAAPELRRSEEAQAMTRLLAGRAARREGEPGC